MSEIAELPNEGSIGHDSVLESDSTRGLEKHDKDHLIDTCETVSMEDIPELAPYISGSREYFIIDSGLRMVTVSTQKSVSVPRYTVWGYDPIKERLQIVEAGDSVEPLQKKYGVNTVHSRFASGQSAA